MAHDFVCVSVSLGKHSRYVRWKIRKRTELRIARMTKDVNLLLVSFCNKHCLEFLF